MANQLVSVVIPTFNRAYCIETSIRSVLQQTHGDLEVIVVDDGSTDDTQEVVKQIGDSRVRYVRQSNAGACVARNHGVDLAKGDIVAFQDSDDLWLPTKLEKQVAALQATGADYSTCRMSVRLRGMADDDPAVQIVPPQDLCETDMNLASLMEKNYVSTQMLVGKKTVFLAERFDPKMPRMQDWDLALRLMPKYTLAFVDEVLVVHIVGDDSITEDSTRYMYALDRIRKKHEAYLRAHKQTDATMLMKAAMSAQTFSLAKKLYLRSFSVQHDPTALLHLIHARMLLRS